MIKILLSMKLGELRWSQADLSRKTGIRPSTIGDLYNELSTHVNLDHLDKICEALNCELSEILVRLPDKSTPADRSPKDRT
ncbi:MAG: helix-turn-helix transcriptional regulator [Bacteroides sp.]|nr:helix-turn-helix transcriptional regulator [Eubacterium sp.]MCM1418888.1 helix-turn-helix transcriptional regulator [Roseburia sp.]MCM1463377.1 helix-turn-helix transcriptional regulator [Bacteroides sp.]